MTVQLPHECIIINKDWSLPHQQFSAFFSFYSDIEGDPPTSKRLRKTLSHQNALEIVWRPCHIKNALRRPEIVR